jgi:hypothetical protein
MALIDHLFFTNLMVFTPPGLLPEADAPSSAPMHHYVVSIYHMMIDGNHINREDHMVDGDHVVIRDHLLKLDFEIY